MNMLFPFLARNSASLRVCDQILWESKDFVVVPTIGALVPGWVLIVPKAPAICMGAVDPSLQEQLRSVMNCCCAIIQERFGSAAVFEHGPAMAGHSVGCTVDYAHLHVLPPPCDLINSIGDVFETCPEWHPAEGIAATRRYFDQGNSYLYVEQPTGTARIANASGMPSQFFRRVIANSIGRPAQFNWREYPFHENVVETKVALSSHLGPSSLADTAPRFAMI